MKELLKKLSVRFCVTGIAMFITYIIVFILSLFFPALDLSLASYISVFLGIFGIEACNECYKCYKKYKSEVK